MASDRFEPGSGNLRTEVDNSTDDVFASSMPLAYRAMHGEHEIREHAQIVGRRGTSRVHVDLCSRDHAAQSEVYWICVVTDDRPGLLSFLSAAICAHSLDVLSARIFCRIRPDRPDEAVDFFAVRKLKTLGPSDVTPGDVIAIRDSIEALLKGDTDIAWLERRATPTSRPAAEQPTAVRFEDGGDADLLVVETLDRPGLLLTITLALFQKGLSIGRSNVTTDGNRARDEFELVSPSGEPLSEDRKSEVVAHVSKALERTRGSSEGESSTS
jgi:UTP:GlnB (protein PII) uridylyltransferase